jgi:putative MFS transporter
MNMPNYSNNWNKTLELGSKLDNLGKVPLNMSIIVGLALTGFFVYYDISNYAYVSPILKTTWHVGDSEVAYGASTSVLGIVIGMFCISIFADYYGRKSALLMSIAILTAGSILAAISVNITQMIIFRLLIGIGVGSEVVIVAVYIGEISPRLKRGRYTSTLLIFGVVGVVSSGPASFFLIQQNHLSLVAINNVQGWRIVVAIPGVIGFVLIPFRAFMPESPRWLLIKGRTNEANRLLLSLGLQPLAVENQQPPHVTKKISLIRSILSNRTLALRMLLFIGIWSMSLVPIFASLLIVVLYVNQGYSVSQAIAITTIGTFGLVVGAILSILLSDKVERKFQVAVAAMIMGVSFVLRGLLIHDYNALVYSSFLGFAANFWLFTSLSVYASESFPTHIRASISGFIQGAANAIAITGPVIIVALQHFGFVSSMIYLSIFFFFAMILAVLFGRPTVGKSLEELNAGA